MVELPTWNFSAYSCYLGVQKFRKFMVMCNTGCPRKNETHFQLLITLKLFNPFTCLYTSF